MTIWIDRFMKHDMPTYVDTAGNGVKTTISLIMWGIAYKDTLHRARLKFILRVRR